MIVLLIIAFSMLALWEIPSLVRRGWRRELICFVILCFMGFIFSVMINIGVTIPPISTIIGKWITRTFGI